MSWVANLFNPTQASPSALAPSTDHQPPAFSSVQDYGDGPDSKYQRRRARDYAQSMEEEEEEYPRHPYWQVSQQWIARILLPC